MNKDKYQGFTLIELLIVIAIIGIIASIVLIAMSGSRNSALVASYKSTVLSLRTGMEMCAGTGGGSLYAGTRIPGVDDICTSTNTEKYPPMPVECGAITYMVNSGSGYDWSVTTNTDCGGCRLICNVDGCVGVGDCNL